jgi:protein transport protein SEC13
VSDTVASCSEDNKVKIWRKDLTSEVWVLKQEISLGVPAWKVSWSPVGNMLAVSGGDNVVSVFKENTNGEFERVSQVNEEGVLEDQQI